MINKPVLSIILTYYGSEKIDQLADLLESIKNQTYPKTETVYVIEQSSDVFVWIKNALRVWKFQA